MSAAGTGYQILVLLLLLLLFPSFCFLLLLLLKSKKTSDRRTSYNKKGGKRVCQIGTAANQLGVPFSSWKTRATQPFWPFPWIQLHFPGTEWKKSRHMVKNWQNWMITSKNGFCFLSSKERESFDVLRMGFSVQRSIEISRWKSADYFWYPIFFLESPCIFQLFVLPINHLHIFYLFLPCQNGCSFNGNMEPKTEFLSLNVV